MFSSRTIFSSSVWATIFAYLASSSLSGVIISFILLARGTLSELEGVFVFLASASTTYSFFLLSFWLKQRRSRSYKIIPVTTDLNCPTCNFEIAYGEPFCEICGTDLYYCELCHGLLTKEDKVIIAPCCGKGFHLDHLQPYVLQNGKCPACGSTMITEISEW